MEYSGGGPLIDLTVVTALEIIIPDIESKFEEIKKSSSC